MSAFNTAQIHRECGLKHVEFHPTLESTSKLAQELSAELAHLTPALVLAETQTAGRGRGDHSWWASDGALTFTLVLDVAETRLSPERQSLIALGVGAAVRRVIAVHTGAECRIKWPNDVHLQGRKVCGILTEQKVIDGTSLVLIGVGINVNNSLAVAPEEVRMLATSVFDVTGRSVSLTEFLITTLNSIQSQIDRLANDHTELIHEINAHNLLHNQLVDIQSVDRLTHGRCVGISHSGALQLQTTEGLRDVISGSVIRFEDPQAI